MRRTAAAKQESGIARQELTSTIIRKYRRV